MLRDLSRSAPKTQNWKLLRQLRRERWYVHFRQLFKTKHVTDLLACAIESKVETSDAEKRMRDKIPFVKCDAGCGRTVAATRYAPHLEKCLGLGKSRNRRYVYTSHIT